MKDRIPGAPGRYRANLPLGEFIQMQRGEPFTITLTRDDAPIVEGTPYSKAAVLPDDLAEKLCPEKTDPSPADAFSALERTKAPAGYGLGMGSTGKAVTDITANGWYVTKEDTPDGYWYLCHAFVTNNGDDVTIEAWHLDGTSKCKRTKRAGVWGEWEWFNPPLAVTGVEYRTTERYNGYPVYTKVINVGAFPDTSELNFQHGIENIGNVLAWNAINIQTGTNIDNSQQIDWIRVTRTTIDVKTISNAGDWNVRFILKYTKTSV